MTNSIKLEDVNKGHNIYIIHQSDGEEGILLIDYSANIIKGLTPYFEANPFTKIIATAKTPYKKYITGHPFIKLKMWYPDSILKYMIDMIDDDFMDSTLEDNN